MATSKLRQTTLFLTVVAVPPLLAIALSHWGYLLTDGERRCYETLDLDTPGLACSPGLGLYFSWFIFPSFHVVLALPLAWLLSKRLRPAVPVLSVLCLTLLGLSVAPIMSFLLFQLYPPGGDLALLLAPFALCPSLAMLGIASWERERSNSTQAA